MTRLKRETILQKALSKVSKNYDVCLVDCPPSLSLLTVNAIAAAEGLLIPVQAQPQDVRGLALYMSTLEGLRDEINPDLDLLGIVVTFYDTRLTTHKAALEAMRGAGWPVFDVLIGRSVRVAEAAAAGETVITYDPKNSRSIEYKALAKEVNQWLNKTK